MKNLILLCAIICIGCVNHPFSPIIGEFSVDDTGNADIRVSEVNGELFMEIFDKGKWSKPISLVKADDGTIEQLFGADMIEHVEHGYVNTESPIGIFMVDVEFKLAGYKPKSKYIALMFFPSEAYKL